MLGEVREFLGWFRAAFAGWKFLFIPSYRHAVIAGWKFERWYYVAWDVILGSAGVLFSIALLYGCALVIGELANQ